MKGTINAPKPSTYPVKDRSIFIFDAEEGMIISRDVFRADGKLIASQNTELTHDLITKISDFHVLEVHVYDTPEDTPVLETDELTYFDKIRQTETFEIFHEDYIFNVTKVKTSLNDMILNNAPIDTDRLLKGTSHILSTYTNNLQLFDMLHCMRQFDDLTYVHCVNVALMSSIIGKWLNYPKEDIEVLTLCGLLHDIGKLLVPNHILSKPDRLTPTEYEIMKTHVNLGYEHLKDQDIDQRIKDACLLHHEKCDGSGYPYRLTSDKIPAFAKIVTIADIYDAMTSARVYRSSICPFHVIAQMERDAYTKFDPQFMLPFMENVVTSYIHNNVRLSNGQIGEVVLINKQSFSRPMVRCNEEFIDLAQRKDLTITEIL